MFELFCQLIRRFYKNDRGNIVILAAIFLPILITVLGVGIDFAIIHSTKQKVQQAADIAVLAGLRKFSEKDGEMFEDLAKSKALAQKMFKQNLQTSGIKGAKLDINFVRGDKNKFSGTANWDYEVENNFLKMINIETTDLIGKAEAKYGLASTGKYADIHFMIDVSASMGVPATQTGANQLKASASCEFSCHTGSSYEQVAKRDGIILKMDVITGAIYKIFQQIQALDQGDQFRVAIHVFDDTARTELALTDDMSAALSAIQGLKVTSGHTQMATPFDYLRENLKEQGKGRNAEDRIQFVVFLSDNAGAYTNRSVRHVGDVDCNTGIKDRDIKLVTMYTTYVNVVHSVFTKYVQPYLGQMASTMASCASEDSYYQTNNVSDIELAFEDIFNKILLERALMLSK